jgi:hypothetical protein
MMTRTKTFPSGLWDPSTHHDMAPGAVASVATYGGFGLDKGALRVGAESWYEILMGRTPTETDPRQGEWVFLDLDNPGHIFHASAFRRYGPGWSYGPFNFLHDEAAGFFVAVYHRSPTTQELLDLQHDRGLYNALFAEFQREGGFVPPSPPTPPAPPAPPVSPPVNPPVVIAPILPPLSPAAQRVEELRPLLLALVPSDLSRAVEASWPALKPLAVAALSYFRRVRAEVLRDPRPIPG